MHTHRSSNSIPLGHHSRVKVLARAFLLPLHAFPVRIVVSWSKQDNTRLCIVVAGDYFANKKPPALRTVDVN